MNGALGLIETRGLVASIEAELLEDDAPRLCGYLRSVLPMDGTMVHAKFAGEETIVMVPFFAEQENPKLDVVAGDIGYYPGRQTLCFFYGRTAPFGGYKESGTGHDLGLESLNEYLETKNVHVHIGTETSDWYAD